jgi:hypothetical protein
MGQLQKAEEALANIVAVNESSLGGDSPSTVATKLQLVSLYSDASSWPKVEILQQDVLEASMRVFGKDSEQAQNNYGQLRGHTLESPETG